MSGSSSSGPRKNASKTTRNSNAEVKRRGNADVTNVWSDQLTDDNDPTPSYDELNRVDILPDGWVHISVESEEIPNRDELQCRGSLDKVLKWYRWIVVYPTLKKLVDDMGFEKFCSINAGNSNNRLIHALVEQWWPSTHTFHFPCEELGFTPLDFAMLTGISFGRGHELSYDERYSKLEEAEKMFPGITISDIRYGNITFSYLKSWKEPLNPRLHNYDSEIDIVYARAFIVYMMGNLFFSNGVISLRAGYLAALTDYDILGTSGFEWGTPIIAILYWGLDEVLVLRDRKVKKSITGFYAVLEFWFFEYCRVGMYLVKMTGRDSVPYDPPQEIMEFSRYDREIYQRLKDADFYDGGDYLILDVDYMTYWHRSSKSQDRLQFSKEDGKYLTTDDPRDMGWFMDMAGPNDQHKRIPIPVMQVPYPCSPTYSTDELWHQNQGLRYAAYEDSRQYVDRTTELEEQLRQRDEII
ncbi:hypothetical protein GIB67_005014 [Kingdonia uniflora]|uniref:Aminotransferase-like plant mobile domain-containing protein n=1 Tax=Kingdonia uniflora TaxID=39325 RepID=A0A7J7NND5_9MAGN|nr:hypothetical protein GIB67_005014 [Kingdonia uniflora]